MTRMNVRPYHPRDIAALARLFTDTVHLVSARDYSAEQSAAWAPDPPDLEHWRTRLGGLIALVAENASGIVGFATFEPDGHLDHLYVHYRFLRQGVATALYRRIEQEARSRGLSRIHTEASTTARPFFGRMGFKMIAPQTVEHGGVMFTNYRMEKLLI